VNFCLQGNEYSELKEEILNAAKHGEDLLNSIRQHPATSNTTTSTCASRDDQLELYRACPYRLGNVTAVERLALFFFNKFSSSAGFHCKISVYDETLIMMIIS
jgi:hypothetical protein